MAASQPAIIPTQAKDYSQYIDFPVEIIGRDGIIREYTFEQSIRLYQYRIRNARLRYQEAQQLQHEIEHCTKRIAQLRRSFFARYAWESFQCEGPASAQINPVLAGEIAAYLRRLFGAGVDRPPIVLHALANQIEEHASQTLSFSFSIESSPQLHLLHVFQSSPDYLRYRQSIDVVGHQDMREHVWDSYSVGEVHLVIASDEPKGQCPFRKHDPALGALSQKFLRRGYESLLKGYSTDALDIFITVYENEPYSRGAYWGAAIVAEQLRAFAEAEFALVLGVNHFPNDAGLQLRLAAAYVRRNAKEAKAQLHIARQLNGDVPLLQHLRLVYQIQNGELRNPLSALMGIEEGLKPYPGVRRTQRWLLRRLRNRFVNTSLMLGLCALLSLNIICHPEYIHNASVGPILVLALSAFALVAYRIYWNRSLRTALLALKGRQLHLLPSADLGEIFRSLLNGH